MDVKYMTADQASQVKGNSLVEADDRLHDDQWLLHRIPDGLPLRTDEDDAAKGGLLFPPPPSPAAITPPLSGGREVTSDLLFCPAHTDLEISVRGLG